jgi:hypothetical protein
MCEVGSFPRVPFYHLVLITTNRGELANRRPPKMSAHSAPDESALAQSIQSTDIALSEAQIQQLLPLVSSSLGAIRTSQIVFGELMRYPLDSSNPFSRDYSQSFFNSYSRTGTQMDVSKTAPELFTRLADLNLVERPEEHDFHIDAENGGMSKHINSEVRKQRGAEESYKYMLELISNIKTTHEQLVEGLKTLGQELLDAAGQSTDSWPTETVEGAASTALKLTRDLVSSVARFRFGW